MAYLLLLIPFSSALILSSHLISACGANRLLLVGSAKRMMYNITLRINACAYELSEGVYINVILM